ncbi:MAG: GTPase ObgE [Firmicutes bacterium]|nr:GTPase ObgE [Bacillota bacterium]
MFCDEVKIFVEGGKGGDGASSFRREIYVPKGGPDGGDGGRGGDVILRASSAVHTLLHLRYHPHLKAERGKHGSGRNRHGRSGEDLIVDVPAGVVIMDEKGQNQLFDLLIPGQKLVVARGGRGGRGNARFATSRRRAPTMAEKGEPGEKRTLLLQLKLVADVGIIGLPNAGKSTLLARISAARPKVAPYPFTTLEPQLGLVDAGDRGSFVAADLPGLIEGAHQGAGLGHKFLRHAERTRVFIHVIDIAAVEGRDPLDDYQAINCELSFYKEEMAYRPRVIAANKIELPGASHNLERLKRLVGSSRPIFPISAVTGEGVADLVRHVAELIASLPCQEQAVSTDQLFYLPPQEDELRVEKKDGVFIVRGREVERLAAMTDWQNEDALRRFHKNFARIGADKLLREKGIQPGDTVVIGKREFIYQDPHEDPHEGQNEEFKR